MLGMGIAEWETYFSGSLSGQDSGAPISHCYCTTNAISLHQNIHNMK